MLECVVNVSQGSDRTLVEALASRVSRDLLDLHSDPDHNRSVFTLVGELAPRVLARAAVSKINLPDHTGVHPRLGVVDVVPFVPLAESTMADALRARNEFAAWAVDTLHVPCFFYGPERSLPYVRKHAFGSLMPDVGTSTPHPTAGAICVGARPILVAYNIWLAHTTLTQAHAIVALVRSDSVRALALQAGQFTQISMNLIDINVTGPADVYNFVASHATIERAELVGLATAQTLAPIARTDWSQLDLGVEKTIEWRIATRARKLLRAD
ncbi:MAG: hypothetical protein EXQ63_07580 [Ilumatobacteraceae bacterium]|nr:hypothetical protein [Ilumatobacteraceae bacterium]